MIIIVIHIIRCLVKGDKIMKLKEHLVARELAEIEIRNMIKDFRKGRPILRDCRNGKVAQRKVSCNLCV